MPLLLVNPVLIKWRLLLPAIIRGVLSTWGLDPQGVPCLLVTEYRPLLPAAPVLIKWRPLLPAIPVLVKWRPLLLAIIRGVLST